jgi:hypothetical protein
MKNYTHHHKLIIILFFVATSCLFCATSETELNNTISASGVQTINIAGSYTGKVTMGNPGIPPIPVPLPPDFDYWKIASGSSSINLNFSGETTSLQFSIYEASSFDYSDASQVHNWAGGDNPDSYSLDPSKYYYIYVSSLNMMGEDNYSINVEEGSILPVELVSFTSSITGVSVNLNWQTATEVNNYGFDVERLFVIGQQSLVKWERIGFVEGHGNCNSPQQYSFIDVNPPDGNLQYRLKQIDTDGRYKYYSTTAEVDFSLTDVKMSKLPKEFSLAQNYPNPFNPSTNIQYTVSSTQHITLKIYDVLGNEMASLVNEEKTPGNYEVRFDGSNLAAGVYFYRLNAGSFTSTKKFMLTK